MFRKSKKFCVVCEKETRRRSYKYCSNSCQMEFQYRKYIEDWKNCKASGLQGLGIVSGHIKRYLRRKYADKCCLCGWAEINTKTGLVPLVADHIDGNWRNNAEENLRLVCPNCDSLSPTYTGSNRGKAGRKRGVSKRYREARATMLE